MKKNWIVTMEVTVKKEVYLENCTKEQAESNPWDYSEDELEIEMLDWEILKIEEND